MEGEPKLKLNSYGEIAEDETNQPVSDKGYVNEKGEFIRGKDSNNNGKGEEKDELPVHLL